VGVREPMPCHICGEGQAKVVFERPSRFPFPPEQFLVVQCQNCGLMYTLPMLGWDELARYYEYDRLRIPTRISRRRYGLLKRAYRGKYQKPCRLIDRLVYCFLRYELALPNLDPGMRILEIGCGIGRDLTLLKELGFDVFGVEPDAKLASVARMQNIPG